MTTPTANTSVPLDDTMLAMDIADTLGREPDSRAIAAIAPAERGNRLNDRLRAAYARQGITLTDRALDEGIAAFGDGRFTYRPPPRGPATLFATLYVSRRGWGRWGLTALAALVVVVGGYFYVYRPYQAAVSARATQELQRQLPARMDQLYLTIYDETKVQTAAHEAARIRDRGKEAARRGDRAGAEDAIAGLIRLRDTLREEYTLRVVNSPDVRPGFWTFPRSNTEPTNYYIVVEAIGRRGAALSLPIRNGETGGTETVERWALRVPESVYESVSADKRDDGVIQHSVVGIKQFGFLDVDYTVPVIGGTLTRW